MNSFGTSLDRHVLLALIAVVAGMVTVVLVAGVPLESFKGLALTAGGAALGTIVATAALKVRQHFARSSRMRRLKGKAHAGHADPRVLMSYHKEDDDVVEQITKYLKIFDFEINFDRSGELSDANPFMSELSDDSYIFLASHHSCKSNFLMNSLHDAVENFEHVIVVRLQPDVLGAPPDNVAVIDFVPNLDDFGAVLRGAISKSCEADGNKPSHDEQAVS